MTNLWDAKRLGEVYDVRDGTHDSPKYQPTGHPLITSKNLRFGGLSFENVQYISNQDYQKINERSAVHKGDVLFAMIGTIGNPTLVGVEPRFAIKNVALFKVPDSQNGAFLKYYLSSETVLTRMMREAKGTTQKFVGLGYLRDFPIRVPPLPEQQRIVGILDEAFEGIATAKANAEKNLQNARALLSSQLNEAITRHGNEWSENALEEVVHSTCSLSYGIVQPGEEYSDGLPIVRPTDLTERIVGLDKLKRIDPRLARGYGRTALRGGELLLCVRGTTGTLSVASKELVGANVTRGIVPIRFGNLINSDFAFYLISSDVIQRQICAKTYGTALRQINIRDLRKVRIIFPPLAEQQSIAAKLDKVHLGTQRLEAIYQQKLAALEDLKRSLLHQAFSGNL